MVSTAATASATPPARGRQPGHASSRITGGSSAGKNTRMKAGPARGLKNGPVSAPSLHRASPNRLVPVRYCCQLSSAIHPADVAHGKPHRLPPASLGYVGTGQHPVSERHGQHRQADRQDGEQQPGAAHGRAEAQPKPPKAGGTAETRVQPGAASGEQAVAEEQHVDAGDQDFRQRAGVQQRQWQGEAGDERGATCAGSFTAEKGRQPGDGVVHHGMITTSGGAASW